MEYVPDLKYILRRLVGDPNFLKEERIVNVVSEKKTHARNKGVIELGNSQKRFITMAVGTQATVGDSLTPRAKAVLPLNHLRVGLSDENVPGLVKRIASLELNGKNIMGINSGVNFHNDLSLPISLLLLQDPSLLSAKQIVIQNYGLEMFSYLYKSIICNAHIDNVKNSKRKIQENKTSVGQLLIGEISPTLIQRLVNIMEVNLLVCYLDTQKCVFYWAQGKVRPTCNPTRELWAITVLQNHVEPIICQCEDTHYCRFLTLAKIIADTEIKNNNFAVSPLESSYFTRMGVPLPLLLPICQAIKPISKKKECATCCKKITDKIAEHNRKVDFRNQ